MNNSPIENEFIGWCHYVHPDINPYIFIQRYNRYYEEYLPLIDENMVQLHHQLSLEKPNIECSFKGRIKSKRSFFIKTFKTMAENIAKIFPEELPENEEEKEKILKEQDDAIDKYFKFLASDEPQKFNKIKHIIKTMTSLGTVDSFRFVFNKLSSDEKDRLVNRLGRTEDTFAYRPVINSVDFNIKSVRENANNEFEIIDSDDNVIPIHSSITFSPEEIIEKDNGSKYILIDGKEQKLNERNLLYPYDLSSSQRNLENALKSPDGKLTMLQDSIVIDNKEHFDICSININPVNNQILMTNQYGESKNLSLLLNNHKLNLRKTDEEYTIPAIYDVYDIIKKYYSENDIIKIESRFKDYIENPKNTGYMSIHDSSFNEIYGYTMEAQIRDLKMEDDCKNESSSTGHDQYKIAKSQKSMENPILSDIIKYDSLAFDSSTSTLIKKMDNPNIEISDLLGKYLLVTRIHNGNSISYQPNIATIFEHTFGYTDMTQFTNPDDKYPPLDMSNYKNFIKSRKLRNEAIRKEKKFPDLYE